MIPNFILIFDFFLPEVCKIKHVSRSRTAELPYAMIDAICSSKLQLTRRIIEIPIIWATWENMKISKQKNWLWKDLMILDYVLITIRTLYKSTQKPPIWKWNKLILWTLNLELLSCVNQIQTDYVPAWHNSVKTYIVVIFLLHFSIPPSPCTSLRAIPISTLSKKNSKHY